MKNVMKAPMQLNESQKLFEKLQADTSGFMKLSERLKLHAGINLPMNSKNLCLMASRLAPVLRARGVRGYRDYLELLGTDDDALLQEFVSALTTNTTQFFREPNHFDVLRQILPEMIAEKTRECQPEIRIWCAAASTGQEPYSLLMTLLDFIPDPMTWSLKFLATDIDLDVLNRACNGTYSESEVAGIPPLYRQKYLHQVASRFGRSYQFADDLRRAIRFAPLNLCAESYPFQHPFDIVFCRNVLIYFEPPAAADVVGRLVRTLRPNGYLFLGHSESGVMKTPGVTQVSHAVYKKKARGRETL